MNSIKIKRNIPVEDLKLYSPKFKILENLGKSKGSNNILTV